MVAVSKEFSCAHRRTGVFSGPHEGSIAQCLEMAIHVVTAHDKLAVIRCVWCGCMRSYGSRWHKNLKCTIVQGTLKLKRWPHLQNRQVSCSPNQ